MTFQFLLLFLYLFSNASDLYAFLLYLYIYRCIWQTILSKVIRTLSVHSIPGNQTHGHDSAMHMLLSDVQKKLVQGETHIQPWRSVVELPCTLKSMVCCIVEQYFKG